MPLVVWDVRFRVTEIGGSGDTLNRLEEIVEEERTKAAGRARVARDQLDLSDIEAKDAEQDALAEMALADFAAQEGIELESEGGGSDGGGELAVESVGAPKSCTTLWKEHIVMSIEEVTNNHCWDVHNCGNSAHSEVLIQTDKVELSSLHTRIK